MRYFVLSEFDSPDSPGSGVNMDSDFLEMLDKARERAEVPFRITSGYRTKEHNKAVGGVENSSHTLGLAADISCEDSARRYLIIEALLYVGFNRIGIAPTFIHVDLAIDRPQNLIWTY
tara:strand:+ start:1386 stop:1739 length:354 start_codon:yes stop_codon:yes gene_type:complete